VNPKDVYVSSSRYCTDCSIVLDRDEVEVCKLCKVKRQRNKLLTTCKVLLKCLEKTLIDYSDEMTQARAIMAKMEDEK